MHAVLLVIKNVLAHAQTHTYVAADRLTRSVAAWHPSPPPRPLAGRDMLLTAMAAVSFSSPVSKRPLPLPTPAQLAWQEGEIMALIHFNMATFVGNGDPGCTENNWADSSKPARCVRLRLRRRVVSLR